MATGVRSVHCRRNTVLRRSSYSGRKAPVALGGLTSDGQAVVLSLLVLRHCSIDACQFFLSAPLTSLPVFCQGSLPLLVLLVLNYRRHSRSSAEEVRMICVDISSLNRDQRLYIYRTRTKTLTKKVGYHFNKLSLKAREPQKFLRATGVTDLDKFFVD